MSESKNGIDRREFATGSAAVGLACILPGMKPTSENMPAAAWVCLKVELGFGAYLAEVCNTGAEIVVFDDENVDLGDCSSPATPGCHQRSPTPDLVVPGIKPIYRHPNLSDEKWLEVMQKVVNKDFPKHVLARISAG